MLSTILAVVVAPTTFYAVASIAMGWFGTDLLFGALRRKPRGEEAK